MMLAASLVLAQSVTYADRLLHFKASDTSAYSLCVIFNYFWLYCWFPAIVRCSHACCFVCISLGVRLCTKQGLDPARK